MRGQTPGGTLGFTLIELLIAIALLAVMAAFGYRGLSSILDVRVAVTAEARKWQDLVQLFSLMEEDMIQALERPVRGLTQTSEPALSLVQGASTATGTDEGVTPATPADSQAALWLTRIGAATGDPSPPQRVGYRLRDGIMERLVWPSLDRALASTPQAAPLGVSAKVFTLRCLGDNNEWIDMWPPPGTTPERLPRAIEVTLTLTTGETLMRRFAAR